MPGTRSKTSTRKSIAQLAQLSAEADRRKFFTRHRGLIRKEFVEQLAELVVERVRVSTQEALHLAEDRKSTRLNSSHVAISYAVFCLKKKTEHLLVGDMGNR